MRYFTTASKDATVYSDDKNQNTGIDQILEVSKWKTSNLDRHSRAFIKFDLGKFKEDVASNRFSGSSPEYILHLKSTKLRELAFGFDLEVMPIASSWEMGLGKRQDNPITTDGVSYRYRVSADDTGSAWNTEGGDFLSVSSSIASFTKHTVDLDLDITDLVNEWLSDAIGSIDNHGLVVKFTDAEEQDGNNYGTINFFSEETHTIYRPKLSVNWDDSDISNQDAQIKELTTEEEVFVTFRNLKQEYKLGNQYRFKMFSREQFPTLTFSEIEPGPIKNHYLATGSQYSIIDNVTEETIVPFGSASILSRSDIGNFFEQDFIGWEAERTYRIIIKIVDGSDNSNIIDKNFVFKLVE